MKNRGAGQAKPADQPQSEEQPKTADLLKWSRSPRTGEFPHALKHGAFSALSTLPGEDEKEFNELHRSIAAELLPDGPIENDLVKTIALSLWRASHLTIFRRAEWARAKYGEDEQSSDEIPKTEPARSNYKNLKAKNRQNYQAAVLSDIATVMNEKVVEVMNTTFNVVNTIANEMNMVDLKEFEEFQKGVQVLNSPALQCLSESKVKLIMDVVDSYERCREPSNDLVSKVHTIYKALGLSKAEAKKTLDDAKWVAKEQNYLSLSDLLKIAEDDVQLAMCGDVLTEEHLEKELAILEKLDATVSRATKTLMQIKTMKEIIGTDPRTRAARAHLVAPKKSKT